ncbi:hypothetical protein [Chloroflexus sp.]|uniref:hypothetical protein n=1 Tax=Chloroflexus sp. TaxID=1904827 RepID=UPI003C70D42B
MLRWFTGTVVIIILTACGAPVGSSPVRPTVALDQSVSTQPPAATRIPDTALPTAVLTVSPSPTPAVSPTTSSSSIPTIKETSIPPLKESPMPIQPAPPFNAQPLQPPYSPTIEQQIAAAKQDLAQRLGIDAATIEVVSVEAVTWPDGSLGCPRPGMAYTQVLIDGLLVQLRANGQMYPYHGDGRQPLFLCDSQAGSQSKPPRQSPSNAP